MVDDLKIQRIIPSQSTAGKVTQTDRRKEQNQHSSFEKHLRQKKEKNQKHDKDDEKISAYRQILKHRNSAKQEFNEWPKIKEKYRGMFIDIRA